MNDTAKNESIERLVMPMSSNAESEIRLRPRRAGLHRVRAAASSSFHRISKVNSDCSAETSASSDFAVFPVAYFFRSGPSLDLVLTFVMETR